MPAELRDNTLFNLRQTLDWRAQYCQPLDAPEQPVGQTRFGALGEALWPQDTPSVCDTLRAELRETLRTVESTQPRLERNRRLAMHSARLGQLACELEQRGQETLEEIRGGLEVLWV
jgi:hypothetical protein